MKKINFEYTGVLYYYFIVTKESIISNQEFKSLIDFVTGYLGIDKKYAGRDDVGFYFEYDLETLATKFAIYPYLWCGNKDKTRPNTISEDYYIGCDDISELKNNMANFVLTNDSKAKKHLQEAVIAYIEYKREINADKINEEINNLHNGKSLVRSIINRFKK